jgi:hypothetical protein
VDHPLPWLRYVDADKITVPDLALDGMKVRNDAMEKLGTVDGFIVDNTSMRPYYVVVDSGGWFKSKDFLVPIGHARLDDDRDALVVDVAKSRIEKFPGFDRDTFDRLGENDIRRMNDAICGACSDTTVVSSSGEHLWASWDRPDYRQPDWWRSNVALGGGVSPGMTDAGYVARATGELQANDALERDVARRTGQTRSSNERVTERERELVVARETEDVSPHFDGRAQPGDVIGLETGGERTHIGETSEDENKRRVDAIREMDKRKE